MIVRTRKLSIDGMHCSGCEMAIEQALASLPGIRRAKADYAAGSLVVSFDPSRTSPARIAAVVKQQGYGCTQARPMDSAAHTLGHVVAVLFAMAGIAWLLTQGDTLAERFHLPQFELGMSYSLLFLVGLFTGFHCVGMCGGFVVGYTARGAAEGKRASLWPHLLYGFGKTLSYSLFGGIFGLLGSVVAFTPQMRGYAAIIAGAFLILFGINMLNWFPVLRRIGIHMPRFLGRFMIGEAKKHHGPFVMGFLNGLMIACGPLQAMYIMAAGTGSFVEGAKLLLIFGLGTLPVMLGFGLLASVVSGTVTHRLLKLSSVLVMALGLIMLNRGLVMTGSGYDFDSLATLAAVRLESLKESIGRSQDAGYQIIRMEVNAGGYSPDTFRLKQGVPVKWIIEGKALNECNRRIMVPALGLEFDVKPGENVIEFTPRQAGVIPWSCWMGMIRGSFIVEPASEPNQPSR